MTGERGDALKRRLRTGTVVSYDDRNWELRWSQERRRINHGRAIAVDMESATLATQGYRLRVPYGTLLCVSDKPLHGEIKLPGAASDFYRRAVGEHLNIGLVALDILRAIGRGSTRTNCAAFGSRFRWRGGGRKRKLPLFRHSEKAGRATGEISPLVRLSLWPPHPGPPPSRRGLRPAGGEEGAATAGLSALPS